MEWTLPIDDQIVSYKTHIAEDPENNGFSSETKYDPNDCSEFALNGTNNGLLQIADFSSIQSVDIALPTEWKATTSSNLRV
jgi:hypothetical protein